MKVGKITIFQSRLSKEELVQLSRQERTFFLAIAHISNELNAIHKLLLWISRSSDDSVAQLHGKITYEHLFLLLLAGKIKEAWRLFESHYFNKLSKEYDPLLGDEAKKALSDLKRYFGSSNLVDLLRNKFAFHYSPDDVDKILPKVDEDLLLYMEKGGSANNLYYFAEALAGRALLDLVNSSDHLEAYKRIRSELPKIAGKVLLFVDHLMHVFLSKNASDLWEGGVQEIILNGVIGLLDIEIPWFTNPSKAYEDSG